MTDYAAKVKSGIALLDAHFGGSSWKTDIDLDTLDLGSCSVCVLGQLFGNYSDGLDELGIIGGYSYGFDQSSGSFRDLTAAWKDALGKNNTLVEQGDVYRDTYNYSVRVIGTQLVRLSDTETITVYIVATGSVKDGVHTDYKSSTGKIETAVLQKKDFEAGGTYSKKVDPALKIETGMFIELANGRKYFVHNKDEVRELVDGAYAESVSKISLVGAKEMKTGMGYKFGQTVKNTIV